MALPARVFGAATARDLWSFFAGVAITGVPIIYSVDGREYLTITAGPLGRQPTEPMGLSPRAGAGTRGCIRGDYRHLHWMLMPGCRPRRRALLGTPARGARNFT